MSNARVATSDALDNTIKYTKDYKPFVSCVFTCLAPKHYFDIDLDRTLPQICGNVDRHTREVSAIYDSIICMCLPLVLYAT
jgi:hypothetical protein